MARRFIQSEELVTLADELAGRDDGRGRPRTVALRRSTSTAYYAVFHRLTQHTVQRLLGDGRWTDTHAAVARWMTHTDLAALAKAATGVGGGGALGIALGVVDERLGRVGQLFVDLQDRRHQADYDDLFEIDKASALTSVDDARQAVALADALHSEKEGSYQRFLGLAVGGAKIAKRR